MRRIVLMTAASAAVAIAAQTALAQQPGGMPGMGRQPQSQPSTEDFSTPRADKPDVAAQKAYRAAVKSLNKAKEREQNALNTANPDRKAAELAKARDDYYRALDMFTEALSNDAELFDAWNSAGFVHFRLGAYGESIDDYDHALKLHPDSMEATLYRAQSYLHEDRLDDAKSAYMDLFNHARPYADQLLSAMEEWLKDHRADAKGMRPTTIDSFDSWVKEREKIAAQAAS